MVLRKRVANNASLRNVTLHVNSYIKREIQLEVAKSFYGKNQSYFVVN